jgi:hypothetical protein
LTDKKSLTIELIRRNWDDRPAQYFEDCLTIQPKTGANIPFRLNTHQQRIQAAIDSQRRAGKPVRILILKPRQTGISTLSAANLFHDIRFGKGVGMVVSKDLDSAEHIFSIIQRFHHYLPDTEQDVLKTVASNRKELKFEEPHGGRIVVETAGKSSAGHSFTIRSLLLSESSRWPEGCEDTRTGLLNAVPYAPDTVIINESVANGMSGWFYQQWHKPDGDYEKIFLAWFEHDEYSKELPMEPNLYSQTLEPEELRLIADFKLTLEQIEWRRWAIRNNCEGDLDRFKEQYPATAREAFIASGASFFHIPSLDEITTSEPLRCDLRLFKSQDGLEDLKPMPNPRGHLHLFNKPQAGHDYVIGVDVAEGIEIDDAPAGDTRDYSDGQVLDRNTGEQVAEFHAQITPDELGRQLVLLGRYYNFCYIGVESNGGYGNHTMDTMKNEGYPAHLIFRQDNDKWGWQTTKANKKSMLSSLDMAIRRKEIFLNGEDTLSELRAFITKPDGRLQAGSGHKDDRVMALGIANYLLAVAPAMQLARTSGKDNYPRPIRYKPMRDIYQANRTMATAR